MTIHEKIFDSKIEKKIIHWYKKLFSIDEFQNKQVLIWAWGAILLSYFVSFNDWAFRSDLTKGQNTGCWPYYQSCGEWHIFELLPYGFSQLIFYMFLFSLIIGVIYFLRKKDYFLAHLLTLPLFIWHFLGVFILTYNFGGNYEYFLFIFGLVLLWLPHKEWFLKVALISLYFMASTIKIDETWIVGNYFTSMETGIPFIPDSLIPIFTNGVILAQLILVWFIFSKNKILRYLMIVYFITFHIYSGFLVGYKYPSVVLPIFLIIFVWFYQWQKPPLDKKSIPGWTLIILMFSIQFISIIIPGNERLTMEGNKYGLYMFEANHQCISTIDIKYKNGEHQKKKSESESARNRCETYRYWWRIRKEFCSNPNVEDVAWTFDHSINGNPFLRIVDEEDACVLKYKALGRNDWIKTEKDNPKQIGLPVKNWYK